jgi:hypothetical protein
MKMWRDPKVTAMADDSLDAMWARRNHIQSSLTFLRISIDSAVMASLDKRSLSDLGSPPHDIEFGQVTRTCLKEVRLCVAGSRMKGWLSRT